MVGLNNIEIVGTWLDDLLWCPSQCYLRLRYLDSHYVLYLRWRWDDPWTADLIHTDFTFENFEGNWIDLDIPYFTQFQLEECKKAATEEAFKLLKSKDSEGDELLKL